METVRPIPAKDDAFRALLDDPSPKVRQYLLGYFSTQGEVARQFLEGVALGSNRALAWHARWYLEELKFTDPAGDFRDFIRSLNYELETGALLMARTVLPSVDTAEVGRALDALAAKCRGLIAEPVSIRTKCRVMNRVLFHDEGFRGNTEHYTDPFNSLLPQVLERRKGIPISLSMVYLLVAQRLGLALEPVGLPGHFLVGCYVEASPFFVDAFEGGVFRSADDLMEMSRQNKVPIKPTDLAPTPVREVLCRCCRNLAHHYATQGEETNARLFASFVDEFDAAYSRHLMP